MTDELVHTGAHADILASGRNVGPGDLVSRGELTAEDQHLLEEGRLVEVVAGKGSNHNYPPEARDQSLRDRAAELEIQGRSKMSADELRAAIAEKEASDASS